MAYNMLESSECQVLWEEGVEIDPRIAGGAGLESWRSCGETGGLARLDLQLGIRKARTACVAVQVSCTALWRSDGKYKGSGGTGGRSGRNPDRRRRLT